MTRPGALHVACTGYGHIVAADYQGKCLHNRHAAQHAVQRGEYMLREMETRALDMAAQLGALSELDIAVMDSARNAFVQGRTPKFCAGCGLCDAVRACEYGGRESLRWGGTYVYFCEAGLAFATTALYERDALRGCMMAGPMLLGQRREDALSEVCHAVELAGSLPLYTAARLSGYCRVADACAADVCLRSPKAQPHTSASSASALDSRAQAFTSQLRRAVAQGDRIGAQRLMNEILGDMYFSGDLDVNTLRMRALRLVDMFSKCGAPGFFRTPDEYAHEIARFDDIDSLNVWLGELARGFVCYAFNFTPAVNADALFKARRYVREHLSEKISLDEVAAHVHLSRSYVSSMFHQQTGEGLFEYIQRLRLERACALLRGSDAPLCDIAAACGFEDQSYFTRAFRKAHGVTPGAFRRAARNPAGRGC